MAVDKRDIEHRLTQQVHARNIRAWRRALWASWMGDGYEVTPFGGESLVLKPAEAYALLAGIESAVAAEKSRQDAEARARAELDAEQAGKRAAEADAENLAVETTGCPTCKAEPGQRCTREQADPTPYAAHPHAPRLAEAGVRVRQAREEVFGR
jgi:hypothetical protein